MWFPGVLLSAFTGQSYPPSKKLWAWVGDTSNAKCWGGEQGGPFPNRAGSLVRAKTKQVMLLVPP
jgi:hypothetical protein